MSFSQENTTQVKRFACDRCHDQKLRCPRPVNGGSATVPCIRCQRAGTVCNISSPLKTGRPSKALKLQARTEQRSSSVSPSLSRTSSNNTTNSQVPETSGTIVSDYHPENGTYPFQELDNTFLSYASDVSSQHESFQVCDQSPAHSVVGEHSRHLNFDLEITSPMDMNSMGTGRRDTWECTMPHTMPQYYPTMKSTSIDLVSFPTHDHLALDPFLYNTDTGVHVDFLQDCMAKDSLNYDAQSFPYHLMEETVPAQDPCKSEPRCQGPCCIRPDMVQTLEDQRLIWPSPDRNAFHQDTTSINANRRPSESKSLSTLSDSDCGVAASQAEEVQQTQSLLQLQMEIYDCSAIIFHAGATSEADVEGCQNQSRASSKLFNATERFIKLISDTQILSTPTERHRFIPQPHQPAATTKVNANNPEITKNSPYCFKRGASSHTPDGSYDDVILDSSGPRSGAGSSNTAFFHLMMGCYTRLLTAYETVVEISGSHLSDAPRSTRRPSMACLSSTLATENDLLLRSQPQLQAISYQLSKLNNVVRAALISSQCQRQPERYSRKFSAGSLHQARRSPSPPMLEESAIEAVEEQERALQVKIEKLKGLLNKPRHVKKSRSTLGA